MIFDQKRTETIINFLATLYGIYGLLWLPFLLYTLFAVLSPEFWRHLYSMRDWPGMIITVGFYLHALLLFLLSLSVSKRWNWGRHGAILLSTAYLINILKDLPADWRNGSGFAHLFFVILIAVNAIIIFFFLLPSTKVVFKNRSLDLPSEWKT